MHSLSSTSDLPPTPSFTGNAGDPRVTCFCALQWCRSQLSDRMWPLCSLTFQCSVFIILLDYYLLFLIVCGLLIEPWMVEKNLWIIKHFSQNNLCPWLKFQIVDITHLLNEKVWHPQVYLSIFVGSMLLNGVPTFNSHKGQQQPWWLLTILFDSCSVFLPTLWF